MQSKELSVLLVGSDRARRSHLAAALVATGVVSSMQIVPVDDVERSIPAGGQGDLAIIDAGHLDVDSHRAVEVVRDRGWCHIVVTASSADPWVMSETLRAGAQGYFISQIDDLDGCAFDDEPASKSNDAVMESGRFVVRGSSGVRQLLTAREVGILQQIAEGSTNKGIAAGLGLSPLTVKSHLARIGKKLRTGDRAAMVFLALRAGVIQ
jgi:DNA-binding NarL/FixJ family response regulator